MNTLTKNRRWPAKLVAMLAVAAVASAIVLAHLGGTFAAPADIVVELHDEYGIPDSAAIEVGASKVYQLSYLKEARSSEPSVATVAYTPGIAGTITVTGVKAGKANAAYTNSGGAMTALLYHVIDSNNVSAYTIGNGGEMCFGMPPSPTQRETRPSPVTVTAGQFGRIAWSSANPNVAKVASDGAITAIGKGVTVVIGEFTDKWGVPRDLHILVGVGVDPSSGMPERFDIGPDKVIEVGEMTTARYTIWPPGTTLAPTWSTSDAEIASVNASDGTIIGLSEGVAYITATLATDPVQTDTIRVAVNPYPGTPVRGILIAPPGHLTYIPWLNAGSTMQFTAYVFGAPGGVVWDISGNNSPDTTISSDGLLTVSLDESVDDISVGATSVADNSISKRVGIIIRYPLSGIDVEPPGPIELHPGESQTFNATLQSTGTGPLVYWEVQGNQSSGTSINSYGPGGLLQVAADEPEGELTVCAKYNIASIDNPVYVYVTVYIKQP